MFGHRDECDQLHGRIVESLVATLGQAYQVHSLNGKALPKGPPVCPLVRLIIRDLRRTDGKIVAFG